MYVLQSAEHWLIKMKKIALVTGGAGFIGSHMVDLLLRKNFEVKVVDNLSTGRLKNLKLNFKNKKFYFKKIDIKKINIKDKFFKNINYIFHFAGVADLVPSINNPEKYIDVNLNGTIKLLELAKKLKLKKFVYAASASCYGKTSSKPVKEDASINLEHPYALSKYLGEKTVFHWGKIFKFPVVSLRIFNAYGPRSRTTGAYGAVMGVFFKQKLKNKPLTIVGDGNQSRDFVYVTDVVNAFFKAGIQKSFNEVYNVGTGRAIKINYLAKLIGGKKLNIPDRPGEAKISLANISKIKRSLKWKPKTTFEKGIKFLLSNINDWKDAPLWTPIKIKGATKNWFKYLKNAN